MERLNAQLWREALDLKPHPEGGWYRETYRAAESVAAAALPPRFGGPRNFSTAIFFLLEAGEISALHRIRSDEVWHFYDGAALELELIHPEGRHETLRLGQDPARGFLPQAVAPAGVWFGAAVPGGQGFALCGCTVAPGFDFADFELANRDELIRRFPAHAALIRRLTRPAG